MNLPTCCLSSLNLDLSVNFLLKRPIAYNGTHSKAIHVFQNYFLYIPNMT